jgi:RecB family exonuclease
MDETPRIRSWSYNRLLDFERCKLRAKLKYLDRIPELPRPLPEGKKEQPNDRGTRIHLVAEQYVRGASELIPELDGFAEEFAKLRLLFTLGEAELEGDWGFNDIWEPCSWQRAWLRAKLDAIVTLPDAHMVVIDYKTGKRAGNEIKHNEQMLLYALATVHRYPAVQKVTVELWYLDEDQLVRSDYDRHSVMRHFERFNKRAVAMTSCTEFPARPNMFTCRFCTYGPKGSGDCKDGV